MNRDADRYALVKYELTKHKGKDLYVFSLVNMMDMKN